MTVSLSDIAAFLALALSGYATWRTIQFNERQKSFIETQEALMRRQAQREDSEAREQQQADLGATFVKIGSSTWRLKIFNKGRCAARNVSVDFVQGKESFIDSDIESKFPMQALQSHQSVELIAAIHMGSPSKYEISLRWADDYQTHNQRTVYPTL